MFMKAFASWDRFILPYPFTECCVMYGVPVSISPDVSGAGQEACRRGLEDELNRITRAVDSLYGHQIS